MQKIVKVRLPGGVVELISSRYFGVLPEQVEGLMLISL